MSVSPTKLQEILARAKATVAKAQQERIEELEQLSRQAHEVDLSQLDINWLDTVEEQEAAIEIIQDITSETSEVALPRLLGVEKDVILNDKQNDFNRQVQEGKDVVLIGAAGTGKTTSMRRVTSDLIKSDRLPKLKEGTKWLATGSYGAVILSYTRKAVNNIRHAVVEELKPNTLTIHKLLEFQPNFYEIEDPANPGQYKKTMVFEPARNSTNPLPTDIVFLAFEESSMISVQLYKQLQDAMPHAHQEVFLGDIQQLPPIFGLAILGFKLLDLPVVELTEVYRQALESPIIALAHKILEGNPHEFSGKAEEYKVKSELTGKSITRIKVPGLEQYTKETEQGSVVFQVWQKQLSADIGLISVVKQFTAWDANGYYNPQDDIILCPYNKAFGTIEINKGISQYLGVKRQAKIYEIIAGFNKHYLAVGDRVLFDKEDAFIVSINHNGGYLGKRPMAASANLDRWGQYQASLTREEATADLEVELDPEALDNFMASAVDDVTERVQVASHVIELEFAYGGDRVTLDKAAEVNNLLGGYAITVHKAQGSEWEKVFFIMHSSHAVMNQRELLYTAVTRAKKHLHIIAERDTFFKGIKSQRIKGDTIKQKAEFFKGKKSELDEKLELEQATHKQQEMKVISGNAAIKLEELVPELIRQAAEANLASIWDTAVSKFGQKLDGRKPELSFSMYRKNTLGLANYSKWRLILNPVWCAVAAEDSEVWHEMLVTTLTHEVCHFIDKVMFSKRGHGPTWRYCMQKMDQVAAQYYTGEVLPPWMEAKNELLKKVFDSFKVKQGEELVDTGSTMDEVEE